MKKIFLSFVLFSVLISSYAQILKPVKWSFSTGKSTGNQTELIFTAKIDEGWYLYSQSIPEGGPIATSFKFNPSSYFELISKTSEPEAEIKYDENFQMDLRVFHNKANFIQKIKVLSKNDFKVTGTLEFMCCDNKRCLPPEEVDFSFNVKGNPQAETVETVNNVSANVIDNNADTTQIKDTNITTVAPETNTAITDVTKSDKSNSGLLSFFIISFIAGLAGILTPCVFPMIPMTVTYFVNSQKNKRNSIINSLVYGFSIIAIYTLIGLLVALLKSDADTLNMISTHWLTNLIFFSLFIVFAASFFGMFEITLPSKLMTSTDKQADKGGIAGAFFMALTLVLVSFSCTGPIVGALLIEAAGGLVLKPVVGMFAFGLAFSIPFVILSFFPSLLSGLPKSGGWLNSVKIVMAFIILAFSLKFLVSADRVYHWNLISYELFLAIWMVIFSLLGFYLIGKIRFKHDSELKHISFFRLLLTIATFAFVIYLHSGFFGANLKLISAFLPEKPAAYSQINQNPVLTDNNTLCDKPKYDNIFKLPHNLSGYFDYNQALNCARQLKKPLFVAFTGHACSNCHKMENDVWSDPQVLKLLNEKFVIALLYVDDRTPLPESEWITSTFDGKVKNNIGKFNADFRITRFNVNTQPYYVIIDNDEKLLTTPMQFDLKVSNFINFLQSGLAKFK